MQLLEIDAASTVADIVNKDYRAADVFRKYGISYCCGARIPIATACSMHGVELATVLDEINTACRAIPFTPLVTVANWPVDFLIDYIIHVQHAFLKQAVPELASILDHFSASHAKKYVYLVQLQQDFAFMQQELLPHLEQEEARIFPYIRQIAHAYENKDSYASLLVKTLRKPLQNIIDHDHAIFTSSMINFRKITSNYTPPAAACISHKILLYKLETLDDNMLQHLQLESELLFPRALQIEKELLN